MLRKVWKRYNFLDYKHVVTSNDSNVHFFPVQSENDVINQQKYASLIECLRYVTACTRPDIAYVVGVLSKFERYLIRTKTYDLFYKKKKPCCTWRFL